MALAAHLEYFDSAHGRRARIWLYEQSHVGDIPGVQVKIHMATPSGLIIEAERPVRADDHLEVAFSPDVRVTASVMWVSGKLFGCRFEDAHVGAVAPAPPYDEDLPSRNFRRRRTDPSLSNSTGETLGSKMRNLRSQRAMTQDDVAARLGVSVTSVSHWESDRSFPQRRRLVDLASIYGVPVADLASYYGEPQIAENLDQLSVIRTEIASILQVDTRQVRILIEP